MIWLASFPRSGNTFFRNVLFEVYGLESSTFHVEPGREVDPNYAQFPFVKTHLLPDQLLPNDPHIKSVYLLRDGRDALVSIAHHRQDIKENDSDFYINLLDAIVAPGDSFFGGWSRNVQEWTAKADIVIRFEDLIRDPIGQIERLREITDLPEPQWDKLPNFQQLKQGIPRYGSGIHFLESEEEMRALASKNFRKGKVGNWEIEMPADLQKIFHEIHGEAMRESSYEIPASPAFSAMGTGPIKVLLDATKILEPGRDGIRRYLEELINNLWVLEHKMPNRWKIDLLFGDQTIIPLRGLALQHQKIDEYFLENKEESDNLEIQQTDEEMVPTEALPEVLFSYEQKLLDFKAYLKKTMPGKLYSLFRFVYKMLPFRTILHVFRRISRLKNTQSLLIDEIDFPYDVVHVPLPQRVPETPKLGRQLVVTFHDLTHSLFPQFHQEDNIQKARRGMEAAIKSQAHFLSVSQHSQTDLLDAYKLSPQDSTVIYEAANRSHFFPRKNDSKWEEILAKHKLTESRFFLCLFTIEPRKNIHATIEAFRQLRKVHEGEEIQLWICGKIGWKMEGLEVKEFSREGILFLGFVDEGELPFFYSYAEALCYISHYEGFGLPPLEAMFCATPIIYGNNSSMPEVIGEAGLPANASQISDIQIQMSRFLTNPDLKKELGQKALKHSFQYSWVKMAWETLLAYEESISE